MVFFFISAPYSSYESIHFALAILLLKKCFAELFANILGNAFDRSDRDKIGNTFSILIALNRSTTPGVEHTASAAKIQAQSTLYTL